MYIGTYTSAFLYSARFAAAEATALRSDGSNDILIMKTVSEGGGGVNTHTHTHTIYTYISYSHASVEDASKYTYFAGRYKSTGQPQFTRSDSLRPPCRRPFITALSLSFIFSPSLFLFVYIIIYIYIDLCVFTFYIVKHARGVEYNGNNIFG